MSNTYPHLELNFHPVTYDRKKSRGGGITKPERSSSEKQHFGNVSIQQFQNLDSETSSLKAEYSQYIDPQLIFKIEVQEKEHEDTFRTILERIGIKVLEPAFDKTGYWVVFADDKHLESFKHKLEEYAQEKKKHAFFNSITGFTEIPKHEKIGEQLRKFPVEQDENAYLDVEIWRMPDTDLTQFLDGFKKLINDLDGRVADELIRENFCLLRLYANKEILEKILELREICLVDRLPKPYIDFSYFGISLEELHIEPTQNLLESTAIAVLDSGIISNHPLFKGAVGDEFAISTAQIDEDKPQDDVGHGTRVAGIALYGDIKGCIDEREFKQEVLIISAKIMYAEFDSHGNPEPKFDKDELLEHQLIDVVDSITQNFPQCRIFNRSLGTQEAIFGHKRQFNLALLIDELSKEKNIIFTISAGNIPYHAIPLDDYPQYLLKEESNVKILNPASSALALTVGSIVQEDGPFLRREEDIIYSPAHKDYPSPFTRTGLGYKNMVKPDLVEIGGNFIPEKYSMAQNLSGNVISLNKDFAIEGRLFSVDTGTSYSSPKIAHYLAKLINYYPDYGNNLIKALLLSSAKIPVDKPSPLSEIDLKHANSETICEVLKVYGYGKPRLEEALYSFDEKILLFRENKIALDKIHLYNILLPESFFCVSGQREMSVTLVYDPKVNKNRVDYLGCSVNFRLFKNSDIEEVERKFNQIQVSEINTDDDNALAEIKLKEITLTPKPTLRNRGVHQKAWVEYDKKPSRIDISKPLVLAIICQNRWIKEEDYVQNYAIIVKLEHQGNMFLYNDVKAKNIVRARVRA